MADETFRCPEEVVKADAEANLLDDLVREFLVDVVLDGVNAVLGEVFWCDLHQVGELGL
jgi:hypothetical protein